MKSRRWSSAKRLSTASPGTASSRESNDTLKRRPITAAPWSRRLSSSGRRSIRAAMMSWMVAGTVTPALVSLNSPAIAVRPFVSWSCRRISSM